MYYLNSRYYNPEWGRFINADSIVAGIGGNVNGFNLFVYCFDNPINRYDQSGCWWEILKQGASFLRKTIKKITSENKSSKIVVDDNNTVSHVDRITATIPLFMLDAGPYIGKIGLSATRTSYTGQPNLINIFTELGTYENKSGISFTSFEMGYQSGYNSLGISKAHVYVDSVYEEKWHAGMSVGFDGIGITVGYLSGPMSYDIEIQIGLLPLFFALAPQAFADFQSLENQPVLLPA